MELTGCRVPQKKFDSEVISKHPSLDQLPVERERGITVKAVCATMHTQHKGLKYELNLIDTPGHADFSNEVVRSLDAIQGALLLIDAFRGVEAQTVAHYWRTVDAGVKSIVPVINKIDLLLTKEVYSDDGHLDISASIGKSFKDNYSVSIFEKVPLNSSH